MVGKIYNNEKKRNTKKESYFTDFTFVGVIISILLLFYFLFIASPQGITRLSSINVYTLSEKLFKVLIATAIGALVGFERGNRNRPAGLRTHILVSVGSCIVMIISIELFDIYHEFANFDPARLGAQVISGIGFLGAGTIIRNGVSVKGLTTAASLWVVACIGLAIGSGLYIEGIVVAAIVFFTLHALSNFEFRHDLKSVDTLMKINTVDIAGQIEKITSILGDYNIQIKDLSIKHENEEEFISIELKLYVPYGFNINIITAQLSKIENIIGIEIENVI